MLIVIYLLIFLIYSVNCKNETIVNIRLNTTSNINNTSIRNIDEYRKTIRILKCCAQNEIYVREGRNLKCKNNSFSKINYPEQNIYKENLQKTLECKFELIFNETAMNRSEFRFYKNIFPTAKASYILDNGKLLIEDQNKFERWNPIDTNEFCLEYNVVNETRIKMVYKVRYETVDNELNHMSLTYAIGMLISSFFMSLFLIVYVFFIKLKLINLILMAAVGSLMIAFVLMSTIILKFEVSNGMSQATCDNIGGILYFSFLSNFFWLNVLSYKHWKLFRKSFTKNTRDELYKNIWRQFFLYALYGWGVPLIMTIGVIVIDSMDLTHIPWFIKPHMTSSSCFFPEKERQLYLHLPNLILLIINIIFFIFTTNNIARSKKDIKINMSHRESRTNRSVTVGFILYLKLSVVMGVSWILDAISTINPNMKAWIISDFYNIFIGIALFVLYICNKSVLSTIRKKFSENSRWRIHSTSLTNDSSYKTSKTSNRGN